MGEENILIKTLQTLAITLCKTWIRQKIIIGTFFSNKKVKENEFCMFKTKD